MDIIDDVVASTAATPYIRRRLRVHLDKFNGQNVRLQVGRHTYGPVERLRDLALQ